MPDKNWKIAERKVASFVGGQRTPLSGINSKHTSGDVISDRLYIEVKYRQRFAVLTEMNQVRREAKAENKLPVLVLQEAGARHRYYVVAEDDLEILLEEILEARAKLL